MVRVLGNLVIYHSPSPCVRLRHRFSGTKRPGHPGLFASKRCRFRCPDAPAAPVGFRWILLERPKAARSFSLHAGSGTENNTHAHEAMVMENNRRCGGTRPSQGCQRGFRRGLTTVSATEETQADRKPPITAPGGAVPSRTRT